MDTFYTWPLMLPRGGLLPARCVLERRPRYDPSSAAWTLPGRDRRLKCGLIGATLQRRASWRSVSSRIRTRISALRDVITRAERRGCGCGCRATFAIDASFAATRRIF
jgi:hypothetical protein